MKSLRKYQWVKLARAHLLQGKGLIGHWVKFASRAAFCKGQVIYCGYDAFVDGKYVYSFLYNDIARLIRLREAL